LSYIVCIPLGIAKALRHGGRFDLASSLVIFIGYANSAVRALGMVLKMLFCGTVDGLWDVFPVAGFQSDLFRHALPGAKGRRPFPAHVPAGAVLHRRQFRAC
jgi:microcin C transport system permease protein